MRDARKVRAGCHVDRVIAGPWEGSAQRDWSQPNAQDGRWCHEPCWREPWSANGRR